MDKTESLKDEIAIEKEFAKELKNKKQIELRNSFIGGLERAVEIIEYNNKDIAQYNKKKKEAKKKKVYKVSLAYLVPVNLEGTIEATSEKEALKLFNEDDGEFGEPLWDDIEPDYNIKDDIGIYIEKIK